MLQADHHPDFRASAAELVLVGVRAWDLKVCRRPDFLALVEASVSARALECQVSKVGLRLDFQVWVAASVLASASASV